MTTALIRNGILLGMGFSLVSILIFWRTFTHRWFTGTMVVVGPFQPYILRFTMGVLIGVVIPLAVVLGVRYAVVLHATRSIPH